MKVVTIIMLVLAIVAGSVALIFAIDSVQSPLPPDIESGGETTTKVDNRDKLSSISDYSLEIGSVPLVSTIEDGVYRLNDYSEFYAVSQGGFDKIEDVKTASVTVLVSDEVCDIDIKYVIKDGRVVGGGKYEKVIEQSGVYSVNLNLVYTLTEMPTALKAAEGEKLLLVRYAADDYYSEAFAISLNGGYSRNLFAHSARVEDSSDGYMMLTDELVKNSGEYLYFFSSRLYDREAEGSKFNPHKSVDLFRTKDGIDELVAKQVHHNYLGFDSDGMLCFVRSEYATLSYTVGSVPVVNFEERNFEVIELDPVTMEETIIMKSDAPYSSEYRRFDNRLVRLSQEHYGVLETYDMLSGEYHEYDGMKMRTVSAFDVSDDGRYVIVGGYVSSFSTVNQSIHLIDTTTLLSANISGKELFLAFDGNFEFIDSGCIINSDYNANETKITLYITRVNEIIETFKESVEVQR